MNPIGETYIPQVQPGGVHRQGKIDASGHESLLISGGLADYPPCQRVCRLRIGLNRNEAVRRYQAASVAWRWSVCERSVSPITRL